MGKKSKKRSNSPRVKRMNRKSRLQSASDSWLKAYKGNCYIRGYRKYFGVNAGTAITELLMLEVSLSESAIQSAIASENASVNDKKARKEQRLRKLQEQQEICSDETFVYIEGYTSWGFPYGLTWDELERDADEASLDATIQSQQCWEQTSFEEELCFLNEQDVSELPFNFEQFMRYYDTGR